MTVKNPERTKKDAFDILDGKVKIFRTASKVWQMQLWIKEEQKYVRESLFTEDKESAINKAEERFIYFRSRVQKNEKIFSITANQLRDLFLEHIEEQVKNRQLSKGRQSNIKVFTKHYLDFVGKTAKIQNIDPKKFREYLAFRRQSKSDILSTVVINESITIKQMYRYAVSEGLIPQTYILDFGTMKKHHGEAVRDSFSPTEYDQLIAVSRNWYKKKDGSSEEEKYYRRLLNDFILIMANGGFRTGECRLLKWKDISKISPAKMNGETYAEVIVRAENTKVRKARTIEMRRGDVFQRIKTYSKHTEINDYVFSRFDKNDVFDKTRLYDFYNDLMKEVVAKHENFDTNKTLYSLRHLFITMRIMAGLNVYDIAKITGTSLTQITKHYDAATSLFTSQKMNKNALRFDKHGNVVMEAVME